MGCGLPLHVNLGGCHTGVLWIKSTWALRMAYVHLPKKRSVTFQPCLPPCSPGWRNLAAGAETVSFTRHPHGPAWGPKPVRGALALTVTRQKGP